MKTMVLLLGFFLIIGYLFSCTPKISETQSQTPPAAVIMPVKAGWQEKWEQTLTAARKEGKVIIYSTVGSEVKKAFSEGFQKRTGIIAEFVTGRSAQLVQKILTERQNGIYMVDIYVDGATTLANVFKPKGLLDPIEKTFILPEVKDTSLWYNNRLPFIDKDRLIFGPESVEGVGNFPYSFYLRHAILKGRKACLRPSPRRCPPQADEIVQGDELLSSHSGLALAGAILDRSSIRKRLDVVMLPEHPFPEISHGVADSTLARGGYSHDWAHLRGQARLRRYRALPR